MRFFDHIRSPIGDSPAHDLAADEVLLDETSHAGVTGESLRVWEASQTIVVVGRSSQVDTEVNVDCCQRRETPILRRCSGGCAIVAGAGCLMYAVTLDLRSKPALRSIDNAHTYVLGKILDAVHRCGVDQAVREGQSDLVLNQLDAPEAPLKKFSGNSLRITRDALLYHGTILYQFPISLITDLLRQPPHEPEYRRRRSHCQFVTNIAVGGDDLVASLRDSWGASPAVNQLPHNQIEALVDKKYRTDGWNFRH